MDWMIGEVVRGRIFRGTCFAGSVAAAVGTACGIRGIAADARNGVFG